jgi:hypothetical protein
MDNNTSSEGRLVISYITLRTVIGLLGIMLPFILSLGGMLFFKTGLQTSISAYYHTQMRDVFVGVLFATGFFLYSYRGYDKVDNIAGNLACLFALGVALFPTTPDDVPGLDGVGLAHLTFAALYFATLIFFSLRLFTKTDPNPDTSPSPQKRQRNLVYRVCGITMLVCLILMAIYNFLPLATIAMLVVYKPVYWLEALAILTFGISWFTKGENILKDRQKDSGLSKAKPEME